MCYKGAIKGRCLGPWLESEPSFKCCNAMASHIAGCGKIIRYEPSTRTWGVQAERSIIQQIYHCPWCGIKLPPSLSDELETIIFDDFKFDDFDDPAIPEEFKSELWWKKRGL